MPDGLGGFIGGFGGALGGGMNEMQQYQLRRMQMQAIQRQLAAERAATAMAVGGQGGAQPAQRGGFTPGERLMPGMQDLGPADPRQTAGRPSGYPAAAPPAQPGGPGAIQPSQLPLRGRTGIPGLDLGYGGGQGLPGNGNGQGGGISGHNDGNGRF